MEGNQSGSDKKVRGKANPKGHSEKVGEREDSPEKCGSAAVDSGDNVKPLGGRPRDYAQVKKNVSLTITPDHWDLCRKAAYPKSRSQWLSQHLEEHRGTIEAEYARKIRDN